jgi:hypothetical protein
MKHAAGVPDEFYADFKEDFQHTTKSEFVNLMVANQRFRPPDGLGKAAAPTLVVAGQKEWAAMRQSAWDLVSVLPCAKGGLLNLGKGSSMAKEHNWAMTAPDLFARTVRAWIEEKPVPPEIEDLRA